MVRWFVSSVELAGADEAQRRGESRLGFDSGLSGIEVRRQKALLEL